MKKTLVVGPYSKAIQRGALGDHVDGRSREGKMLRRLEAEMLAHLGRPPSISESLLIRRICRMTLQLELFDQKLSEGQEFTANDGRVFNALSNQVRLGLRDLGIKPRADDDKPPSLATIAARHKAAAE